MITSAASPIIGIDLGTTYSLASVFRQGRAVVLPNALGEVLTPSAVSIDDQGRVLVGAPARARAATAPLQTALGFKRDMGTDRSRQLGLRSFRPEELSALVLAELKRDAEAYLGESVHEAVITVPAYFGDLQRTATRLAGELAGLKVERIINEPTAAALAYGLHHRDQELRAIVLDLGGGTFDVTVLEIIEGVIEVQSSAGDARLGGEDFVEALEQDVIRQLREERGLDVSQSEVSRARIREACERAKRALSDSDLARVVLPGLLAARRTDDVTLEFTRERAERLFAPLLSRIQLPIARALRDAKLTASQLDEVLLVGGATRMPCFIELAARTFGRMPNRKLPPDEAVAYGAAVQAALKQGEAAIDDLVVTDVAPFSLGVATASRMGQRLVEGIFSPIIDRGTVIPVSRSERFHTLVDNQERILVEVFQGEHSMCRDNTRLGELAVAGLPRAAAGETSIDVRFTYDLNGILEVEATVEGTGKRRSLVLERRPGGLSPEQIELARAAMERLKFHPRDTLPNRTALARAEELFAELTGEERRALSAAMAVLQMALEAQDPKLIVQARERLVALTSQLRTMPSSPV